MGTSGTSKSDTARIPRMPRASARSTDPRVIHTITAVKSALLDLTRTHDPEKISISLLCRTAGISRPTFYEHFEGIYDVYDAIMLDRLEQIELELVGIGPKFGDVDLKERLTTVISYLDAHRDEFLGMLDSQRNARGNGKAVRAWWEHHVSLALFGEGVEDLAPERADRVRFVATGLLGTLSGRVMGSGPLPPPNETAAHIDRYVRALSSLD